jgi:hypothetical protein
MQNLDYQSAERDPSDPHEMDYNYGCFPAVSICVIAAIVFLATFGVVVLRGLEFRVAAMAVELLLTGITAYGWILTGITLKRRRGVWAGLLATAALLVPTLVLFLFFFFNGL